MVELPVGREKELALCARVPLLVRDLHALARRVPPPGYHSPRKAVFLCALVLPRKKKCRFLVAPFGHEDMTVLEAMCVVAASTHSAAVKHALSSTCAVLRAVARHKRALDLPLTRCFADGHVCVSNVLRSFCAGRLTTERLIADSIAEAVGAVQTHAISVADLEARGWGEYSKLRHMCTLIVAGAVNVDTWRSLVPSGERRHAVYVGLLHATDKWATR